MNVQKDTNKKVPPTLPKTAPSLKPGEKMMIGCVEGRILDQAVRDGWIPTFPITELNPAEYAALASRQDVFSE